MVKREGPGGGAPPGRAPTPTTVELAVPFDPQEEMATELAGAAVSLPLEALPVARPRATSRRTSREHGAEVAADGLEARDRSGASAVDREAAGASGAAPGPAGARDRAGSRRASVVAVEVAGHAARDRAAFLAGMGSTVTPPGDPTPPLGSPKWPGPASSVAPPVRRATSVAPPARPATSVAPPAAPSPLPAASSPLPAASSPLPAATPAALFAVGPARAPALDAPIQREILWTWADLRRHALVGVLFVVLAWGLRLEATAPTVLRPPEAHALVETVPRGPRSWQDLPLRATPTPIGPAMVSVLTTPPGALVRINAAAVGTTPLTLTATDAGEVLHLSVERAGYQPWEGEISRDLDGRFTVNLELGPLDAVPPPE